VVAGSNPAVPTLVCVEVGVTFEILLGIIGFMLVIVVLFFGSFVLLDLIWGRRGGDV
jgi:hypothetical protein